MMVWMPLVFCMRDGVSLCGSAFLRSRPRCSSLATPRLWYRVPMHIVWKGYYGAVRAAA